MIYVINGKPYVKVANYYKEVSVEKKGNEYSVKPVGGIETRVEKPKSNEVTEVSVSDFYLNKNKFSSGKGSSKSLEMNMDKINDID